MHSLKSGKEVVKNSNILLQSGFINLIRPHLVPAAVTSSSPSLTFKEFMKPETDSSSINAPKWYLINIVADLHSDARFDQISYDVYKLVQ
jgi:hypothetical protein